MTRPDGAGPRSHGGDQVTGDGMRSVVRSGHGRYRGNGRWLAVMETQEARTMVLSWTEPASGENCYNSRYSPNARSGVIFRYEIS